MLNGRGGAYFALHLLLALYSCSGILSKLASEYSFASVEFVLCYGGMIGLLGIYAICWQQIIKRLPLTTAYANRAVTVIWGMVWGVVIFSEHLSFLQVFGGLVVLAGVALYAFEEGRSEKENRGGSAE